MAFYIWDKEGERPLNVGPFGTHDDAEVWRKNSAFARIYEVFEMTYPPSPPIDIAPLVNEFDRELSGRLVELQACRENKSKLRDENKRLREALSFVIGHQWIPVHMGQRLNRITITLNDDQLTQFQELIKS